MEALTKRQKTGLWVGGAIAVGAIVGAVALAAKKAQAAVSPSAIAGNSSGPKVTSLSLADDGKTVSIAAGDTLTIQLPANPSTGYVWTASLSGDTSAFSAGASSYTPSNANSPGAGGVNTWKLPSVGPGTVGLTFTLARGAEAPQKTVHFTVNVAGGSKFVAMNFAPAGALEPGKTYVIAAVVPGNAPDANLLAAALAQAGWSAVNVLYFPGAGSIADWPTIMPYPTQNLSQFQNTYVAQGTYNGAAAPVPAGVTAMQSIPPTTVAATEVTTYKGIAISVASGAGLWVASAPLGAATMTSIGTNRNEVVEKLKPWIDKVATV